MESYLDAMLADSGALNNQYRSHAYLRDTEQPDILKTFVQCLSGFTFQLSYNSSILNVWSSTPLILAGLVESQRTPTAVVRSTGSGSGSVEQQPTEGAPSIQGEWKIER